MKNFLDKLFKTIKYNIKDADGFDIIVFSILTIGAFPISLIVWAFFIIKNWGEGI